MSWLPPRRRVPHPSSAPPPPAPASYRPTDEQPVVAWVAPRCPFCRSRDSKRLGRYPEKRLRYLSCRKCGGRYKAIEVGEDAEIGTLETTARELAAGLGDGE